MRLLYVSVSEFGKDHGLIHEAVVTGRKVGAGSVFWSRLVHNENLFRRIVKEVVQMCVATLPFDPVTFIGKKWAIVPEERDARSLALSEVDFSQVLFETCLNDGESSIKGEEKFARLKASGKIRLGATVFAGLWAEYQAHKENSVLERLYKEQSITYVDFFGDVLLDPGGRHCVLCLSRAGAGAWRWSCGELWGDWSAPHRSASLAGED